MKAYYDSEANALSIELVEAPNWDDGEGVDEDYCTVDFWGGRPVNIELLKPADNLRLLEVAAERFDLDSGALVKAASAALAKPDRTVTASDQLAA